LCYKYVFTESREFFVVYPAETDTKLANKVLIAKKESIEEGAERFRRDLLHNLSNHLVSARKAYCLLIDSSIEEHIVSSVFSCCEGFCFWYLHFNLQNHFYFLSFSRPRRSTSMMVWNRRGHKRNDEEDRKKKTWRNQRNGF